MQPHIAKSVQWRRRFQTNLKLNTVKLNTMELNMRLNMKFNRSLLIVALGASTLGLSLTGQSAFAENGAKGKPGGAYEGRRGGPYGGPRGGGRMMERMADELKLTSSQKTKIQTIMKDSRERARKIHENKSLSEDQKRTKMMENRAATKKRMDAVLTSTQKKKLAEMRKQMRERRRQNGGPGGMHRNGQRKPI
jgi:Spy/CpxP family protein refolding chaperone